MLILPLGRCHQSNNIYFVAKIAEQCVYQKCYACVDFKGFPIKDQNKYDVSPEFDDKDNSDLLLASASY